MTRKETGYRWIQNNDWYIQKETSQNIRTTLITQNMFLGSRTRKRFDISSRMHLSNVEIPLLFAASYQLTDAFNNGTGIHPIYITTHDSD